MKWLASRTAQKPAAQRLNTDVKEVAFRPVLTGSELMQTAERRKLAKMLAENSPLSQSVTEAWWLQPAQALLACVQDCPAAWRGPYSGPGGFGDLSLSVAVRAVRLVRGMMLPPGAASEEQSEQAPGWVCAVFWAGLFHHLAWLTQAEGATEKGRVWYPGLQEPDSAWRIRPAKEVQVSQLTGQYMAARLLPASGMLWLQRWPEISHSLLQFMAGERSGVLYGIITEARQGAGLDYGNLSDASGAEFVSIVPEVQVTETAPNLAHIAPVLLSSHIISANVSEPIGSEAAKYTAPQSGDGSGGAENAPPVITALVSALDSIDTGSAPDESAPDGADSDTQADLLVALDRMTAGQSPVCTADDNMQPQPEPEQTASAMLQSATTEAVSAATDGERFMEWLRESVEGGTLTVNERDSPLHVLAGFVFLVSPDVFFKFIASKPENNADKNRLQKSFEALGLHHSRNGKGLYHYHKYDSPDKSGRFTSLSGYMVRPEIIFKRGSCPADSIWLSPRRE
ncbi:conjugal transfer nickase/helicase domain-containing protein [Pantoea agglomerans]|uniref:conjugal transfer nickase/helicase domain-containing protein n=1 Tax=Enterobacter agglomerans TaxID=549 RepID=UPI0028975FC2|nr:TraI domain-containing protein [Pantoea agglomerans]WNK34915.1 TraI domain-containing protein [Pantoea agglomerans]